MEFQSIKTSDLKKVQIEQILNLKNSHWEHGFDSQLNWFKKNALLNDLHNLLIINDKIEGYTFLANRTLKLFINTKSVKTSRYTLFQTLILNKNFRKFVYLSKLMNFNSKIIYERKKPAFLLCHDDKLNMYKYFGWSILNDSIFKVPDHTTHLKGMIFNADNINALNIKEYNFFFNY